MFYVEIGRTKDAAGVTYEVPTEIELVERTSPGSIDRYVAAIVAGDQASADSQLASARSILFPPSPAEDAVAVTSPEQE